MAARFISFLTSGEGGRFWPVMVSMLRRWRHPGGPASTPVGPGARRWSRWVGGGSGALGGAAGTLYVAFIGLPIIALLIRAAQQDELWNAVTGDLALTALRLSIFTSVVSLAVVVAGGTPFAYLLARSNSWLARVIDGLVELPIVLPPVVAGVAMLMAFGRGGLIGGWLTGPA